ncbi:MAG: penicillin-binding protein 1C [Polyangiales bacterium]
MRPFLQRISRRHVVLAIALAVLLPPLVLIAVALSMSLPPELSAGTPPPGSVVVVDRDGHLLREARADDGTRARWIPLSEMGPNVIAAMIAAEDRRFYTHHGVDPWAVGRAAFDDVRHLRVVSGASTLTMQLARTLRPHRRSFLGKLEEMALAIRIESSVSKERILEEYLNRVAFGPNLRGIGAASRAYLDKAPKDLSIAEAAMLAGLVRGPALYAPDRAPQKARTRRAVVLARMLDLHEITADQKKIADGEPISIVASSPAFGAPHLVAGLLDGSLRTLQPGLGWTSAARVETTIDGSLQRQAEATVRTVLERVAEKNVTAASVVVIDNATGDVLAWVGSPDVFDKARLGANDGVVALRQPGSALKPFLYALAIERDGFSPATVLPDVELQLPGASGTWIPRNYDGAFHGPVRLREALGSSLNVPAAWTAHHLGVDVFLERLHGLGFDSLGEAASFYGPALALGDGEVKLVALANAYATLARGGLKKPLRLVRAVDAAAYEPSAETRVMPAHVAALITDVLRDRTARLAAFGDVTALDFPYDVAAKTGTSKGYRDNWAVGYSSEITVGVWVGNFDGAPMHDVSGIAGAGPIFQAVMDAAMRTRVAKSLALTGASVTVDGTELVRVEVCALSGHRAGPSCTHKVHDYVPASSADALPFCEMHLPLRIDRKNGLRAGPACTDADTEVRIYERLPSEYVAWASAANRPLPPTESSPFCPTNDDVVDTLGSTLAIRRPLDGLKLVIDPERPRNQQSTEIEVVAPAGVKEVTLVVDGVAFATKKRPFVFDWPLAVGKHVVLARAGGVDSTPIAIAVRE